VTDQFDVFVCFGHADEAWALALTANLESAGLRAFTEAWDILPGENRVVRLEAGITGSAAAALVVSPTSFAAPWTVQVYAALVHAAVTAGRPLIPVIFGEAELPPFLADREYVDFRMTAGNEPAYRVAFDRLLAGIRSEAGPRMAGSSGFVRGESRLLVPADDRWRPEGPRAATLRIGPGHAAFAAADVDVVREGAAGFGFVLRDALLDLDLARLRARRAGDLVERSGGGGAGPGSAVQGRLLAVGRILAERFVGQRVSDALTAEIERSARLGASLRLAIEVDDQALAELPWEALVLPGMDGPLALSPTVRLHRSVTGLGPTSLVSIPGPLRILAVIASPERDGRLELLDYERELGKILDVVDVPRRVGRAHVVVLNWGSLAEIRSALRRERFHVLHISCHAEPGWLYLETNDGQLELVSAEQFADEVLIPDRAVPLVVLAGCSTAQAARPDPVGRDDGDDKQPSDGGNGGDRREGGANGSARALPGLAMGLLRRGVPAVLAMTTSVTDVYATELTAGLYGSLASAESSEPLAALSEVRVALEASRRRLPADDPRAELAEWATPTLFLRAPGRDLFDGSRPFGRVGRPPATVLAERALVRRQGDFVGRRGELRRLLAALRGHHGGAVIHGIGGVGKSTLATEAVTLLRAADETLVVSAVGRTSSDQLFFALADQLASLAVRTVDPEDQNRLTRLARLIVDPERSWAARLALLAEHVLPDRPVLLLLDNFEDNQTDLGSALPAVADEQFAAFLARWMHLHSKARLLVTCRYPMRLPDEAHRALTDVRLGPLAPAEIRKLVWRLTGLDTLAPAELGRAVAAVGGHPRTLEYLDALLRGGRAAYWDIDRNLRTELARRAGIDDVERWLAGHAGDVDRSLTESAAIVAGDVLLDALVRHTEQVPLATRLLRAAAVYRIPVDLDGLAWQVADVVGDPSDPGAPAGPAPVRTPEGFDTAVTALLDLGLLAPAPRPDRADPQLVVHRWTASSLALGTDPEALRDAHRRAAAYWLHRASSVRQTPVEDVVQLLETSYHRLAADQLDEAGTPYEVAVSIMIKMGAYDWAEQSSRDLAAAVPRDHRLQATALRYRGVVAMKRGDVPAAEHLFRAVLARHIALRDDAAVAAALGNLGLVLRERGAHAAARDSFQNAATLFEKLGHRSGAATAYQNLGDLAQMQGDYPTARSWHERALADFQSLGDRDGIAVVQTSLGILAQLLGDYAAAQERYREARSLHRANHDRAAMAEAEGNLGEVARVRGDPETAEAHYLRALREFETLGDTAGAAAAQVNLALVAETRGDYAAAEDRMRRALASYERSGERRGVATVHHGLGNLAQERGDYAVAAEEYRRALSIRHELADRVGAAHTSVNMSVLATRRGRPEEGVPLAVSALNTLLAAGSPEVGAAVGALREQRARLGDDVFTDIARQCVGEAEARVLAALLVDVPMTGIRDELRDHVQPDGDEAAG